MQTWCSPNGKCGGKLTCARNMAKCEARQKHATDKGRTNADGSRTGKARAPLSDGKLGCQKRKCSPKRKPQNRHWKEYGVVVAVSLTCYANALLGDFVHDDIPAIMHNRDVTGQTPLLEIFKNDFWGAPMSDPSSHKSYRPLTTLSFR
ncbi:UNVERIFIED_CONTAM: hypothetical protein PYX00_005917 [Menopon gallinae]|uniref:Transmembrane and TPR repeat-containing protein 3 n=1 Tax=Menopon gallinae TaxID=328185 RepID=A0AAW2HTZ1_9NEOP